MGWKDFDEERLLLTMEPECKSGEQPPRIESIENRNCRVCGGKLSAPLLVREMMFGTAEEFQYLTCENCGCLQIAEIPSDLHRYYGEHYYSYDESQKRISDKQLRRNRRRYLIKKNLRYVSAVLPAPRNIFQTMGMLGIGLDDPILDVGSGAGGLVHEIRSTGFTRVLGIDPFLSDDIRDSNGAVLASKAGIFDVQGNWKMIMFNHSFEHMDAQEEVLNRCREILTKDGWLLIRIPTVSSRAFRQYGADWVQLDAPRHLFLHSRKSIKQLAGAAGFRLVKLWDDSGAFQFIGSEQYRRGIPLMDSKSQIVNKDSGVFTKKEINKFRKMAKSLNRAGEGDQFCAIFRPL